MCQVTCAERSKPRHGAGAIPYVTAALAARRSAMGEPISNSQTRITEFEPTYIPDNSQGLWFWMGERSVDAGRGQRLFWHYTFNIPSA